MFLNRRLQALETHVGTNDMPAVLFVIEDADAEAALERAKAEYKQEHPSWQGDVSVVVWVNSEETKDALCQTIAKLSE
jgi:hypothetical protein